ncbi:hypothetical protein BX070DRAFT_227483 [Coemansia spiralis]|nr:hypothetical protein BX070DRAFT_227483 [Coemansia spiralis]
MTSDSGSSQSSNIRATKKRSNLSEGEYSSSEDSQQKRGFIHKGSGGIPYSSGSESDHSTGKSDRSGRESPIRQEKQRQQRPEPPVSGTQQTSASATGSSNNTLIHGRYMPPSLRRQMMAAEAAAGKSDRAKAESKQRESWELLKKRINGPVNKINISNIKDIIVELFAANLIRGRGLFCRSLVKAQSLSTSFTPVYAALAAVVNTKLPIIGELLVTRLVLQFRRAFNRDEKERCISTVMFLAHLTNQRLAHEVLALQILSLLLETPTDDSVEVAVAFMREVGALLSEIAPRVLNAVFDTFRSILHEADIDKRVQYMIEVLFQYRRDGFKDSPIIPDGLDLVDTDEQIIHEVALDDDELDAQDELNVFKFDEAFEENERKYDAIRREILGEGDSSDEGSGGESGTESDTESGSESDSDNSNDNERNEVAASGTAATLATTQKIHDLTETELVNLRRTIYLTIMSSLSFEEAAHKLLKIEVHPGEEQELCNMVIECCSQERTYKTFFGLIGERLCKLNRTWANGFSLAFASCYESIHKYETNHLRNISHFFAHLLAANALQWSVLQVVVMTEETTTSSSRIFTKILLQDLAESLGLKVLNERLKSPDPKMAEAVRGMFPSDSAKSIRFAINYYTSIGLGAITEEMREWLKSAPTLTNIGTDSKSESDSESGSSGSYSSSRSGSYSGSDSRSSLDSRSDSRSYSSASGSDSDSSHSSDFHSSVGSKDSFKSNHSRIKSPKRKSDKKHSSVERSYSPKHEERKSKIDNIDNSHPGPDSAVSEISSTMQATESRVSNVSKGLAAVSNNRLKDVEIETRLPSQGSSVSSPSNHQLSQLSDRDGKAINLPSRKRHWSRSSYASSPEHETKAMRDLEIGSKPPNSSRVSSKARSPSPRGSARYRSKSRERRRDKCKDGRDNYHRRHNNWDSYRRDKRHDDRSKERRRDYSRSRSPSERRSSHYSRSDRHRY